jgi:hypothetical protein
MSADPALLTRSELEYLLGKKSVSRRYESKIKSDIRKKLKTFETLELPLLLAHGFQVTANRSCVTANCNMHEKETTEQIGNDIMRSSGWGEIRTLDHLRVRQVS